MGLYSTSLEHVLAELERIDLVIQASVSQARQFHPPEIDANFRGLYISENDVDALLSRPVGLPQWAQKNQSSLQLDLKQKLELISAQISKDKTESLQQGVDLRLARLANLFGLDAFEVDILLICLAPEIDPRYDRLFAYLQDDITQQNATINLVLDLLCSSLLEKITCRRYFEVEAPLIKNHLIEVFNDSRGPQPTFLSRQLKVDSRIASFLLGSDAIDERLALDANCLNSLAQLKDLHLPDDTRDSLMHQVEVIRTQQQSLVFYFQGPYGTGKQTASEGVCRDAGLKLLVVSGEKLANANLEIFDKQVGLILRETRLQKAALYWADFDALLEDEKTFWLKTLGEKIKSYPGVIFLAGKKTWAPREVFAGAPLIQFGFQKPSSGERFQLWQKALGGKQIPLEANVDLAAFASKFRFSGGQINDAAATTANLARKHSHRGAQITNEDLYAACHLQSNRKLAALARHINPHYHWEDIVLPDDRLLQLGEICNQVKYRSRVYDDWGFEQKLSLSKGLNALFAGPSGTGKTMAAEIMAGELGLELYKINLSAVVSKYIGETEKNLEKIFTEAESSNAILFFDEADALFGKRSEVRDAHDRYANIEIAYLLQRMEEYEGIVILATNLRNNMDEAFVRRMNFMVEFPAPSEEDRRRIWEKIWPESTPLSSELDTNYLAHKFEITGGNIRNIALTAAFLAASDGQVVDMAHLLQATKREYQKMGKMIMGGEFEPAAG